MPLNVLVVIGQIPYPLDTGAKIRSYHLLTRLARKHAVTLVSFSYGPEDARKAESLKPFFREIVTIPHNGSTSSPGWMFFALFFLLFYGLKSISWIYRYLSIHNSDLWVFPMILGLLMSIISFAVAGLFQTALFIHTTYFIIALSVAVYHLVYVEDIFSTNQTLGAWSLEKRKELIPYTIT